MEADMRDYDTTPGQRICRWQHFCEFEKTDCNRLECLDVQVEVSYTSSINPRMDAPPKEL